MKNLSAILFFFSARYRKMLWAAVPVVLCAAIWGIAKNHYSSDMRKLLPVNSRSYKDLTAVLNSGLANKVTIYFYKKDGTELDNSADMQIMQKFADELRQISGVEQVVTSAMTSSQEAMYRDFAAYFPVLYSPEQLPAPKQLELCLKDGVKNMYFNPLGGAWKLKYDPFNWTNRYFFKLEEVLKISGLQFYAGNRNFILSPDRKVCMMLVYTNVAVSDFQNSSRLIGNLQRLSAGLSGQLQCEFFSSHVHMLENANIMKTDLRIFAVSTLLLFIGLFAFVYKWDWRGSVIPVLAGLGGFLAAAVMGVIFDTVLLFTLAMGGVLIGIAGDYGIHLYAASLSNRKVQNGIDMLPKLFWAFFTTAAAFSVFIFTGVPAFIQFGCYSVLTLLFSFMLLCILLPGILFFRKKPHRTVDFFQILYLRKVSGKCVFAALILLVVFVIGLFNIKFDGDIRKFDIAYKSSGVREARYQQSFTKTSYPGILLYSADSYDELLLECRKDKAVLQSKMPDIKMVSPDDFFVPHAEQKKNLQAWKEYVAAGKWSDYKKKFLETAAEYDISEAFFAGFFAELEKSIHSAPQKQPAMLAFTYKSMLGKSSRYTGVSMFDKATADNDKLRKNTSGVVFSEDIFTGQLFRDIVGNLPQITPWAILIIFTAVWIRLRSFTQTCLAFLPVAVCLLSIAGIHGLLNLELTLAVVVAGIITVGIAVDYGLLLVNSNMDRHIFNSIAFSAVTTAAGGLTVFFTHHPMLRAAGVTIVTGILSACFFTFCLLYPLLKKVKSLRIGKKASLLILLIAAVAGGGCTSLPDDTVLPIEPVPVAVQCKYPQYTAREFQGTLLIDYKTGQAAFLIAGRIFADGKGEITGFSPGGIKIFALSGSRFALDKFNWMKSVIPEKRQKELSAFMYSAIAGGIYVPPVHAKQLTEKRVKDQSVVLCGKLNDREALSFVFSGSAGTVVRKKYRNGDAGYLVEYCRKHADFDMIYIYSDKSFFRAYLKLNFFE